MFRSFWSISEEGSAQIMEELNGTHDPKTAVPENRRSSDLSESLLALARKELGEDDEIRRLSIAELKEWITTQDNSYSQLGTYS